jgi:hypothetical protein
LGPSIHREHAKAWLRRPGRLTADFAKFIAEVTPRWTEIVKATDVMADWPVDAASLKSEAGRTQSLMQGAEPPAEMTT